MLPAQLVKRLTCCSLQQAILQGAALSQCHALLVWEARKFSYGAQCQSTGIIFIPITFEALACMSSLAADTIASIGHLLEQCLGLAPQESTCHLFQRVSVCLWRGNAALWIHHCPHSRSSSRWNRLTSLCLPFIIYLSLPLLFLFCHVHCSACLGSIQPFIVSCLSCS